MLRKLLILILFGYGSLFSSVSAQNIITLKNERIKLNPIDYYIESVKDGRSYRGNIGSILLSDGTKEPIAIEGGVKMGIQIFILRNLPRKTTATKILYHIKQLTVTESKRPDGYLTGKMTLVVSFERIGKNDTIQLIQSNVYTNYNRTGGKANMNNYESVLHQLIIQTLNYFDDWMDINKGKHEALSKGIKIDFLPDFDKSDEDTIYYGTRNITWEDFRGKSAAFSRYGAAIFANFGYTSEFRVVEGLIQATIQMKVYMIRGMSWVTAKAQDDYALSHERIHFDIAKLVVERFRKKIRGMQAESIDDLNSMIQYEYLESYREMNRLQREYDDDTQHSLNREEQAKWVEKVRKEIEQI